MSALFPMLEPLPAPAVASTPWPGDKGMAGDEGALRDNLNRTITDLRLSVTDRCNYRCVYCRTGEEAVPHSELPLADYARMVRVFVSLGIDKIRFTGGEPLLRRGLLELIRETARLRPAYTNAPLDLALTTNGHLLAPLAKPLRQAGLSRLTISMDAVDAATFNRITRVPGSFDHVRAGIRAAQDAGFTAIKINCVLMRGINDSQIEAFAEFSRTEGVIVRFIEWMPLEETVAETTASTATGGGANAWAAETVVPLAEIVRRLNAVRPLVPLAANHASETARRYTFDDGIGEIGIIAPVSEPFCGHCSRVRLTADGKLRTCLFSQTDHDLLGRMQRGATDDELRTWIRAVVARKEARHHIGEPGFLKPARSMVYIGG